MRSTLPILLTALCAGLLLAPACVTDPPEEDGGTDGGGVVIRPLSVIEPAPATAYQGAALEIPLRADGGVGPFTWTRVSGDPELEWLQLDAVNNRLAGVAGGPTEGVRTVVVQVTDSRSASAEGTVRVEVKLCAEGQVVPCLGVESGGICRERERRCSNGAFGQCLENEAGAPPSDEFDNCGTACLGCEADFANRCAEGRCACGNEPSCQGGERCCVDNSDSQNHCFDLDNEVEHCGECGRACTTYTNGQRSCVDGACEYACRPGYGRCGVPDPGAPGHCLTNLNTDRLNCGSCGTACPPPGVQGGTNWLGTCDGGSCAFTCLSGFDSCDPVAAGCETNLKTDVTRCGNCTTACGNAGPGAGTPVCNNGSCDINCAPGTQKCGLGCFARNDANHCGGCGLVCSPDSPNVATANCEATGPSGGTCNFTCEGTFRSCDNNFSNGCEANIATSNQHCGACNHACESGFNCEAGVCTQRCNAILSCQEPEHCSTCFIEPCEPPAPCSQPCCE